MTGNFPTVALSLSSRSAQETWGFAVIGGHCHEQVWFRFHDAGDDEFVAQDALEFVAGRGLKP